MVEGSGLRQAQSSAHASNTMNSRVSIVGSNLPSSFANIERRSIFKSLTVGLEDGVLRNTLDLPCTVSKKSFLKTVI